MCELGGEPAKPHPTGSGQVRTRWWTMLSRVRPVIGSPSIGSDPEEPDSDSEKDRIKWQPARIGQERLRALIRMSRIRPKSGHQAYIAVRD